MDAKTVRSKMMEQVEQAQNSAMKEVYGWEFEIEEITVYTTMRHRRKKEYIFLMKTTFEDFPRRAPSYIFVDSTTKEMTEQAWPPGVKTGKNNEIGICALGTRECHEIWHPNESKYEWNFEELTFLDTLQRIHRMMEHGIS